MAKEEKRRISRLWLLLALPLVPVVLAAVDSRSTETQVRGVPWPEGPVPLRVSWPKFVHWFDGRPVMVCRERGGIVVYGGSPNEPDLPFAPSGFAALVGVPLEGGRGIVAAFRDSEGARVVGLVDNDRRLRWSWSAPASVDELRPLYGVSGCYGVLVVLQNPVDQDGDSQLVALSLAGQELWRQSWSGIFALLAHPRLPNRLVDAPWGEVRFFGHGSDRSGLRQIATWVGDRRRAGASRIDVRPTGRDGVAITVGADGAPLLVVAGFDNERGSSHAIAAYRLDGTRVWKRGVATNYSLAAAGPRVVGCAEMEGRLICLDAQGEKVWRQSLGARGGAFFANPVAGAYGNGRFAVAVWQLEAPDLVDFVMSTDEPSHLVYPVHLDQRSGW